ncbi:MAG TPA: bifunctional 2-methylcitrate dehydratase/aconitate hydratase [Frankiaceae bacterium]|nr:bifunctional 2-methylcitrate dehydratase/aconitate hydratase [Frankiaceae bacterium]
MSGGTSNVRPDPDPLLVEIADYVCGGPAPTDLARSTARLALLDALGCALLALGDPECARHLGPFVPGTVVPHGTRVPGTPYELDPVKAAFDIGCLIRWLDFNDTWLAAEWGHPSDNFGGILAVADHLSRRRVAEAGPPLFVADVLTAAVQAYEIQGVLGLTSSFNAVGLDHVLLVRVATAAVATRLLGGGRDDVVATLSQAFLDGGALRAYRHAPNTGSRKSWAAGDATSRGVRLALMTLRGEMGYPAPLSAPRWGFSDVLLAGQPLTLGRRLGSYVMENVLFKIRYPAEFHAQTAVEAAIALSPEVRDRVDEVSRVEIATQDSAVRIIDKTGPLHNPADRDHCLQYMVAVGLLRGGLSAADYSDEAAADPRIDRLRSCMQVREEEAYSLDYLDPDKRSITNAVQVFFADGTSTARVEREYPVGHRRRRAEGVPLLADKLRAALTARLPARRRDAVLAATEDERALAMLPVHRFMGLLATP